MKRTTVEKVDSRKGRQSKRPTDEKGDSRKGSAVKTFDIESLVTSNKTNLTAVTNGGVRDPLKSPGRDRALGWNI